MVGKSTTSDLIRGTCKAIWSVLQPEVLKPPTEEERKQSADDLHRLWDFPNCVGAIDGKHVVVQEIKDFICFLSFFVPFHLWANPLAVATPAKLSKTTINIYTFFESVLISFSRLS